MTPVTGAHSLFASSSTRYTMAVACASVATPDRRWRCIGLTSFPKVPIRLASQRMGLGTFYPPRVRREQTQVDDPGFQTRCLLAAALRQVGKQELAALWLRRFRRTFTCVSHTLYLGDPLTSCSSDSSGLRRPYALARRSFDHGSAQTNCSGCTHGRGHFVPEVVSVDRNKAP